LASRGGWLVSQKTVIFQLYPRSPSGITHGQSLKTSWPPFMKVSTIHEDIELAHTLGLLHWNSSPWQSLTIPVGTNKRWRLLT